MGGEIGLCIISARHSCNDDRRAVLVANIMYNAHYSDFTEDVTVEKFLRADINGDGSITTQDAAAIISYLLS